MLVSGRVNPIKPYKTLNPIGVMLVSGRVPDPHIQPTVFLPGPTECQKVEDFCLDSCGQCHLGVGDRFQAPKMEESGTPIFQLYGYGLSKGSLPPPK